MKTHEGGLKSVLKDRELVYFGHDRFSARMNMAIDEALFHLAERENKFFLRFYDVEKPSIVLSAYDHHDAIKKSSMDFEISRRMSGGRPIYLDQNTFQYCIAGPLREGDVLNTLDVRGVHQKLGTVITDTLNGILGSKHRAELGDTSSVRIEGQPIVGHGQHKAMNHAFLYHGVIVVYKWNLDAIESLLHITEEDSKKIAQLPSLEGLVEGKSKRFYKDEIVKDFLSKIPSENLVEISGVRRRGILWDAQKLLEDRYSDERWIYRNDAILRHDVRFCILFEDGPKLRENEPVK